MARWKLLEAHYLRIEGIEWEYKEVNRSNGREIRKKFPVPMLLDPKIEADWNDFPNGPRDDGQIVVGFGEGLKDRDYVMTDLQLTPGMVGLDDEAKKLHAEYLKTIPKIEGDENATYSQRLLDTFIQQMANAQQRAAEAKPAEVGGLSEAIKAMTAIMEQNTQILGKLVGNGVRRIS